MDGGPRQKGASRIKSDRNVLEINDREAMTNVLGEMERRVEDATQALYSAILSLKQEEEP